MDLSRSGKRHTGARQVNNTAAYAATSPLLPTIVTRMGQNHVGVISEILPIEPSGFANPA